MKRIISLLLAVLMLLTFGLALAEEKVDEVTYPLSDEPINLSFLVALNRTNGIIDSLEEMKMFQVMEDLTNIHFDFYDAADIVSQFNLMCASGDLVDVAYLKAVDLPGGIASYIQDGFIIPLNDLIENYAPHIRAFFEEHPNWLSPMTLEDGTIYGIPKVKRDDILLAGPGLEIREDWLANVGLEVPTTIEEWDAVLKAFKEQDANGNGDANDEIPLTGIAYTTLGQEVHFIGTLALGYGITDTYYVIDDKVGFGPIEDSFYDALQTLHRWYEEGYIDPDYLSNDEDAVGAKTTSNQVGSLVHRLNGGMAKFLTAWNSEGNTDYSLVAAPFPKSPDGNVYNNQCQFNVGWGSAVITSENPNPIETIQWFDYLWTDEGMLLYNYGIEGESYEIIDGKPTYTEEITNNPEGFAAQSAMYKYNEALHDFPGVQVGPVFTETTRWPQQREAYSIYGAAIPCNLRNVNHTAEESEIIGQYWGDINTYAVENINKFIMGITPLNEESFENFRNTLISLHADELLEIKQAAYDRSK